METITVPSVEEIFERVSKLPPDTIVGECYISFSCIIANHLHALHPEYIFSVRLGDSLIEYVPVEQANRDGTFYAGTGVESVPLPFDSPLFRMARGFDRIAEAHTKVTAREATIYLRGFIAATKEGWS